MMNAHTFGSLQRKGFINEVATETYGENVRYIYNTTVGLWIFPDEDFGDTYLVTSRVWGCEDQVITETEDKIDAQASYATLLERTRVEYAAHAAADPMNHMS